MNRGFAAGSILGLLILLSAPASHAKKKTLDVEVVKRQSSATQYTYVVPAYANANCNAYAYGSTAAANCAASGRPAMEGSYVVRGVTLSLLLPDGRIAVVNCAPKVDWSLHWSNNLYRSCREPLGSKVEAVFNGDKAKLEWSVSIDGKKKQGETYKIIGILGKAK